MRPNPTDRALHDHDDVAGRESTRVVDLDSGAAPRDRRLRHRVVGVDNGVRLAVDQHAVRARGDLRYRGLASLHRSAADARYNIILNSIHALRDSVPHVSRQRLMRPHRGSHLHKVSHLQMTCRDSSAQSLCDRARLGTASVVKGKGAAKVRQVAAAMESSSECLSSARHLPSHGRYRHSTLALTLTD